MLKLEASEASEMLQETCDHAELMSADSEDEILVVVIDPQSGYSKIEWEPLVDRWYACGWQPAAEYENGERVAEYCTYLDQK